MCGRYNLRTTPRELAEIFRVLDVPDFEPRYNVAPTQPVLTIVAEADRHARFMRWGLVPHWSPDPKAGPPLINARAETVASKPAFRDSFKARRCLIPASGFYEWQAVGKAKQPYHIAMRDDKPFAFAGLWSHWDKGSPAVDSCAIITTTANRLMQTLHERMPVILERADYDEWLLGRPEEAAELLRPFEHDTLVAVPISTTVNSPRNERPECITPL